MSNVPYPRPPELSKLLDRLEKQHRQQREDLETPFADVDSLDELTASEAYELGHLKGAEATKRRVQSTVNDDITGIYFESRDVLKEAIQNRYTSEVVVTDITPESLTTGSRPSVKLGYSWVELPERLDGASLDDLANEIDIERVGTDDGDRGDLSYRVTDTPDDITHRIVPNLIEQTAVSFETGFVVDFGASSTLRIRLKRAAEEEIGHSIDP